MDKLIRRVIKNDCLYFKFYGRCNIRSISDVPVASVKEGVNKMYDVLSKDVIDDGFINNPTKIFRDIEKAHRISKLRLLGYTYKEIGKKCDVSPSRARDYVVRTMAIYRHRKAKEQLREKAHHKQAVEVMPDTIGQYTGLTDKNGTKIFEGDIVKYGDTVHEVVFEQRNGTAYFGLVYSSIETLSFGHYQDLKQIEVVGNIHDNPELLKGVRE